MAQTPITEQEILAAASPAGGWTRATLAQWGVPWPAPSGWKRMLIKHGYPLITQGTLGATQGKGSMALSFGSNRDSSVVGTPAHGTQGKDIQPTKAEPFPCAASKVPWDQVWHPTYQLRWWGAVLQQMWIAQNGATEWRAVPDVDLSKDDDETYVVKGADRRERDA